MILKKKIKVFNLLYIECNSSVLFICPGLSQDWSGIQLTVLTVWPCLALNLQSSCLSLLSQHSEVNWQEPLLMAPFHVFF